VPASEIYRRSGNLFAVVIAGRFISEAPCAS
jgi:hypothetical protein